MTTLIPVADDDDDDEAVGSLSLLKICAKGHIFEFVNKYDGCLMMFDDVICYHVVYMKMIWMLQVGGGVTAASFGIANDQSRRSRTRPKNRVALNTASDGSCLCQLTHLTLLAVF